MDAQKKKQVLAIFFILIAICMVYIAKTKWQTAPQAELSAEQTEQIEETSALQSITAVDWTLLESSTIPTIIDFGSESCGPCRQMKPDLIAVSNQMKDKANIQYLDVWEYPEGANGFPISVIPTQAFFLPNGAPYVPSESIDISFDYYMTQDTQEHALTLHVGILTESELTLILQDMGVMIDD